MNTPRIVRLKSRHEKRSYEYHQFVLGVIPYPLERPDDDITVQIFTPKVGCPT